MRYPLLITVVIYVAGLGAAGQFSKFAVSFVALSQEYGGQDAVLGLAVSLISLVGVVLGLIAGMVVNRIGTKRALVSALILGAAVSLWQASLPSLPILMLSRIIEGASHLLIVVAAPTLIAETTPDRLRPAALTLWSTFFGVAFAATATIAPFVLAQGGLPLLILSHGVWMAVAAVLCFVLLHGTKAPVTEPLKLGTLVERHIRAFATPGIATPALAWLCYTLTFVSVLTALPLLIEGEEPAWLAPLAPLVSIAVALSLGIAILSRVRALPVITAGFAACCGAVLLIAGFGFSAVTVLLLFAAMAFIQGAGFAVVPQLNPDSDSRALANGALAQMGNLGNLSGTPLLLALYQGAPLLGPVLLLLTAYGGGLILVRVLGKRAEARLR
ncbi:MFS transporter [Marivita hallyeonensis]|uniref:Predicted arabinose efflux permease, MFS family n=1 Tax=Marivita hallyeonensis TaxID=996342 RepID=A0A1M5MSY7_9RHOB|nr:MFS transporter [Marivita hallyeonensis]SHG80418.1 Predicted arabinose efflux permease, MFS family [Marivita hallyeonensis]